jgi:hypothetical protein
MYVLQNIPGAIILSYPLFLFQQPAVWDETYLTQTGLNFCFNIMDFIVDLSYHYLEQKINIFGMGHN